MHFDDSTVVVEDVDHKTKTTYNVTSDAGGTFELRDDNHTEPLFKWAYIEVANLKYTEVFGMATYNGSTPISSFRDGINSNHSYDFMMVRCIKWGSADDCDFVPDLNFIEKTPEKPMITKVEDDKCARCDRVTADCLECACGSGIDCVPQKQCESICKVKGPKYKCSWHNPTGTPTCLEDDDIGTMTKP